MEQVKTKKPYQPKHGSPWALLWSVLALAAGVAIPEGIKHVYEDTLKVHEPFWALISIFSGLIFLVVEKMFHFLHQITENQEKSNFLLLDRIDTEIDNLKTDLKRDMILQFNLSLNKTSQSLAEQLKAEKTIMRIPFNNSETYHYFESLVDLHNKVCETNNNEESIFHALTILKNSTMELKNFFSSQENGGLYKIKDAIKLYRQLARTARSITVIEPKYIHDYENTYTTDYIDFIADVGDQENLKRKYIFFSELKNGDTKKWLTDNKFEIKFLSKDKGILTVDDMKWQLYSHLLFGFEKYFISCSVLPLIDSNMAEDSQGKLTTQSFSKAEYFYLAFTIINTPNGEASNGSTWFKNLIKYHNHL